MSNYVNVIRIENYERQVSPIGRERSIVAGATICIV